MIEITEKIALRLLEQVISGKEDFVYKADQRAEGNTPVCLYVEDGAPSCLVGQVLARAGVSVDVLSSIDSANSGQSESIDEAYLGDDVKIDDDARFVLSKAQVWQDSGFTWGRALEHARLWATDEDWDR